MMKKFPAGNFRREDRPFQGPYVGDRRHNEGRTNHYGREGRLEEEQVMCDEETGSRESGLPEEIMVNPAYPDQLVTIGGSLTKGCKTLLKALLIKNLDIFAWEPADMTGVPRRIIEHNINANPSVEPVCQK
ncbi:reverse transcriptase domain-containing protein [Artemisia annua]|uniref:Reverse transcriptase domain-containing protein n=1 Tax=Artemisia annua TaxID=35608 RepID=A0A2U1L1R3_ARTAN|nr:reverse transcriptase domain-containing protein [Artemisia annua]